MSTADPFLPAPQPRAEEDAAQPEDVDHHQDEEADVLPSGHDDEGTDDGVPPPISTSFQPPVGHRVDPSEHD